VAPAGSCRPPGWGTEPGDEPVEPASSTHPRRLGTRRAACGRQPRVPWPQRIRGGTDSAGPTGGHVSAAGCRLQVVPWCHSDCQEGTAARTGLRPLDFHDLAGAQTGPLAGMEGRGFDPAVAREIGRLDDPTTPVLVPPDNGAQARAAARHHPSVRRAPGAGKRSARVDRIGRPVRETGLLPTPALTARQAGRRASRLDRRAAPAGATPSSIRCESGVCGGCASSHILRREDGRGRCWRPPSGGRAHRRCAGLDPRRN
jgi:hypothetical protein